MSKRYTSDGFTRSPVESDMVPGIVLRMTNPDGSLAPFSDCVIANIQGNVVSLLRPMVWSNGKMHTENFSVFQSRIVGAKDFQTVLLASGEPYTMIGV